MQQGSLQDIVNAYDLFSRVGPRPVSADALGAAFAQAGLERGAAAAALRPTMKPELMEKALAALAVKMNLVRIHAPDAFGDVIPGDRSVKPPITGGTTANIVSAMRRTIVRK